MDRRSSRGRGTTKREFLKAASSIAGLALTGGTRIAGSAAAPTYVVDAATLFDVVVVGAGTAGIPLAIHAAQRGARVLVIEKARSIGGTLWVSGGQMSAAGTRLQARRGIKDSPEDFYQDVLRLARNSIDAPVLRRYVDNAASTLDWLESLGLRISPADPVTGNGHADFTVPRYVTPVGMGRALRAVMLPEFEKAEASGNLRVLMGATAKELVQESDRRVTGVIVEDEYGKRVQFVGRSIVLASGGCMMNKAMFEKYTGKPLYALRAYPTSTGEGIELGVRAGAHVSGADRFVAHRGVIVNDRNYPAKTFTTIGLQLNPRNRQPWEIEVNARGQRHVAEDADIDTLERALTNAPRMAAWLIWDQRIYDTAPPLLARLNRDEQAQAFVSHPMFAKADTIEGLAGRMKLPPATLARTVRQYNRAVATGSDTLGRKHLPLPLAIAPFYAVECVGSALFSQVGLDIDDELRVTDRRRKPIDGLYAIGEVTGGWHTNGNVVINGGSVTPAVTFGRYLGLQLPIGA